MIRAENLSKIYKSKKKNSIHALRDLNFVLPDSGFVFVVGKSGSGKSTLLNILGGLDSLSKGDVVVNGNCFSKFTNSDYDNYRNAIAGFIFQDFHLIDDITVAENIALALDLQSDEDYSKIDDALRMVDLPDVGSRFPEELSGGQKQRVAIARALVKDPKIVLADEPTGNLDNNTTRQILELLKGISKNRLVLMVSHNLNDAYSYADRIMELSDGELISDKICRVDYNDNIEITDGVMHLPYLKQISNEDEELIENALTNGNIKKIKQKRDKFVPLAKEEYKEEKKEIKNCKINQSRLMKITAKLQAKNLWFSMISAIIAACVVMVLAVAQIIVSFEVGPVIRQELERSNQNSLIMQKHMDYDNFDLDVANAKSLVEVGEGDIQAFLNTGYKGNVFELTTFGLCTSSYYTLFQQSSGKTKIRNNFYIGETLGTLITTEEYLTDVFGVNGELNVLCGNLNETPGGVIITDYFADCIFSELKIYNQPYDILLGPFKNKQNHVDGYINAVIYTGYKEKYQELIDYIRSIPSSQLSSITKDERFVRAYDEIVQYLGICYSVNPDFKIACMDSSVKNYVTTGLTVVNGTLFNSRRKKFFKVDPKLKDNELLLSYVDYNDIYKTSYSKADIDEYVPHNAIFEMYRNSDEALSNKIFEFNATIFINKTNTSVCYCSQELFEKLKRMEYITTCLYFDDITAAGQIYGVGEEINFAPNSTLVSSVATMSKAVGVFSDFFFLIAVVLYAALIAVLVNFCLKSVKDRKYEIGIIKALGCKNKDLLLMFVVQILGVGLLTCILSWLGLYLFIGVANDVLVASLMNLATTRIVLKMQFISFDAGIMLFDSICVLLVSLFSVIVPMIGLRNIKPINIIKAKE